MKVKRVVTCLPTKNLQKSYDFYTQCFGFSTVLEENILTVEISNLDLFIIEEIEFEGYLTTSGQTVHFPETKSQVIFSFAVESKDEIMMMLEKVAKFGGRVTQALQPNKWHQESCYIQDPDGHLFEIVCLEKTS